MQMDRCRCGNIDADGWMHNEGHGFGWIEVNVDGWMEIWMGGCRWGWINVDVNGWMDADVDGWIQLQIDGSRCKWMVAYMGQKLQDSKKCSKCPNFTLIPRVALAKLPVLSTCPFRVLENCHGTIFKGQKVC